MAKFFNTSRGPLSATVSDSVLMFAPKAWTAVPDGMETSASLKSLVDQGLLMPSPTGKPLVAATSSKPRASSQAPAPAAKSPSKPASPPSASVKPEAPKADSAKVEPPKVTSKEAAPPSDSPTSKP